MGGALMLVFPDDSLLFCCQKPHLSHLNKTFLLSPALPFSSILFLFNFLGTDTLGLFHCLFIQLSVIMIDTVYCLTEHLSSINVYQHLRAAEKNKMYQVMGFLPEYV